MGPGKTGRGTIPRVHAINESRAGASSRGAGAGFLERGGMGMEPEILIVLVSVFVTGGMIGAAGILLAQFFMRRIPGVSATGAPTRAELEGIRRDVTEIAYHLGSVEERLDFAEQLLGGATPTEVPRAVAKKAEGIARVSGGPGGGGTPAG